MAAAADLRLVRISGAISGMGTCWPSEAVVDFETGLFIELSGTLNEAREAIQGPFLAYGQFYVSEGQNPQLANTQTKLWR
jgi:hypothetical protein